MKKHIIDKQIGERIRKRRLVCGLSQRELAERIGVSFQLIQRYESTCTRITIDRLQELAQALSVEIAYFFIEINDNLHVNYESEIGSKEISQLVKEYKKIKDQTLCSLIHSVIKLLADKSRQNLKELR
ncbi:MAG: helix-turn-helix domain-containing protein [Wolbachia endosymbiont of Fragariocoptes setiger]|nr:helix-turn-helix domain-containing protein [Wolbachia endosymbiont of Fragariocoptes setiger]